MTEHQGTDQFFLGILILHGIDHHWVSSTDTLVTTTAIAHHRNHGSTHTGIAGRSCAREDMRENILTEDTMTQRTVHRLAQTMTIIALDRFLGSLHIILLGLEDERDFIERSRSGKIIYQAEVELDIILLFIVTTMTATVIHHHLTIALHIHKVGMTTGDNGRSHIAASTADYLDIEFIDISLLEFDVNISIIDILLPLFERGRSEIFQHLQLIFRFADEGTQRNCDRQTNHSRAWDSHTHRILEHVGTQEHFNAIRTSA